MIKKLRRKGYGMGRDWILRGWGGERKENRFELFVY
jgi:hypothetical protein